MVSLNSVSYPFRNQLAHPFMDYKSYMHNPDCSTARSLMVCLHEQCFSECRMRQPHPKIGKILFLCGVRCGCRVRHSEKHYSCKQTLNLSNELFTAVTALWGRSRWCDNSVGLGKLTTNSPTRAQKMMNLSFGRGYPLSKISICLISSLRFIGMRLM
jgi:hypothetical protein